MHLGIPQSNELMAHGPGSKGGRQVAFLRSIKVLTFEVESKTELRERHTGDGKCCHTEINASDSGWHLITHLCKPLTNSRYRIGSIRARNQRG
jgi:hypothetical protein